MLFGIFWGGWAVAAADVERALHLSTGGFGLLLSLALVGAAISNAVGGPMCERFGTGRVLGTSLLGLVGVPRPSARSCGFRSSWRS